jgi:hypothetical protein
MRKFLFFLAILAGTQTKAQQITGLWFSGDSSRVYEIKAAVDNTFEAIVKSSSRKTDSAGFIAIKNLHYNTRKKRYEGTMYTLSGDQPCFVKITARNNQLVLKLSRMFLFDAVLTWNRATIAVADQNSPSILYF